MPPAAKGSPATSKKKLPKAAAASRLGSASAGAASEADFLASYDPAAFERPSVAVDVVVLTADRGGLRVLVYQRKDHPHRGRWALPGGFVRVNESLDAAAQRLLQDKTGLAGVFLEQLYTFGAPGRDPRTHIVTVAY